ncbi:polyribonucleotide nucleotidyltransferase [Anopheles sinensis]|uniref:Polyribonucleotide nucleotidyltransferase n=1 Tax=Anopheles sinensis TaxID=74873 RepID=A0A084VR67_ANOSI|nr:polyribonucleotide nucleotidyltransferase [Anopheles sinensis]
MDFNPTPKSISNGKPNVVSTFVGGEASGRRANRDDRDSPPPSLLRGVMFVARFSQSQWTPAVRKYGKGRRRVERVYAGKKESESEANKTVRGDSQLSSIDHLPCVK